VYTDGTEQKFCKSNLNSRRIICMSVLRVNEKVVLRDW